LSTADLLARVAKDDERRRRLRRAQTDLYYLCDEILGYRWSASAQQGLTETHRTLCSRMDSLRDHPRVGTFLPRTKLKTTVFTIGLAIQEILRNPDVTEMVNHAVEEEAEKIVAEITEHFKSNDELRKLRPEIMPNPRSKAWWGSGRMSVKRTRYNRQPTVMGKGAGSEITGAHVDVEFWDDIAGRRALENSEFPKIKSWLQNTALPVLNNNGRIRAVGTRWHPDDPWSDLIVSPVWDCLVLPGSHIDGVADYTLQNPAFWGPEPDGREREIKRLKRLQIEMGPDFAPQIMLDPSPAGEKPWDRGKERFVTLEDAKGPGVVVVLSDPAPAKVGAADTAAAKGRADGTKDDWALSVWKLRRRGDQYEAILLDGRRSKSWDLATGFDQQYELAKKWGATHGSYEAGGQVVAIYEHEWRKARDRSGKRLSFVGLEGQRRADAKNVYFAALASMNDNGELAICAESCSKDFLDAFLSQVREWRPMPGGKNGLRYDDCGNCASMVTDPAIRRLAPRVDLSAPEWSPYRRPEVGEPEQGGRYIRW
jgi:hypothetical protein